MNCSLLVLSFVLASLARRESPSTQALEMPFTQSACASSPDSPPLVRILCASAQSPHCLAILLFRRKQDGEGSWLAFVSARTLRPYARVPPITQPPWLSPPARRFLAFGAGFRAASAISLPPRGRMAEGSWFGSPPHILSSAGFRVCATPVHAAATPLSTIFG